MRVLSRPDIDLTTITDSNGFNLVHLATILNSEQCLMVLFNYVILNQKGGQFKST
jgi:hypothetical protein